MVTEHFCASSFVNDRSKVGNNTLWMGNNAHTRIGSTTNFLYSSIRGMSNSAYVYVSDDRSISGYKVANHMYGDFGNAIASLTVLMPSFFNDDFRGSLNTFASNLTGINTFKDLDIDVMEGI